MFRLNALFKVYVVLMSLVLFGIMPKQAQADKADDSKNALNNSPTYQKFFGSGAKQKNVPSAPKKSPQKELPPPPAPVQVKAAPPSQDPSEHIDVVGLSHNAQNVIGKDQMNHFPEGTDPLQVLADSTTGASYTDGQLRVRGFTENQLGFTMDGIPLDGPPPLIPENLGGN